MEFCEEFFGGGGRRGSNLKQKNSSPSMPPFLEKTESDKDEENE